MHWHNRYGPQRHADKVSYADRPLVLLLKQVLFLIAMGLVIFGIHVLVITLDGKGRQSVHMGTPAPSSQPAENSPHSPEHATYPSRSNSDVGADSKTKSEKQESLRFRVHQPFWTNRNEAAFTTAHCLWDEHSPCPRFRATCGPRLLLHHRYSQSGSGANDETA